MRVTATFADSLRRELDGRAIGDEFVVTARARIVGAEEALVDVSAYGDADPRVIQGDLEVKLLISHVVVESESR